MNQESRIRNQGRRKMHNSLFIIHNSRKSSGFTLIEILISIAIIAALSSMLIFIVNPAQWLAKSRNDQRELNINVILNAIGQNITDNTGSFACSAGPIPTTTATIMGTSTYDIYDCIIPNYLSTLPVDPTTGTAGTSTTYNTQYTIIRNATTSNITLTAPDAELGETISITR